MTARRRAATWALAACAVLLSAGRASAAAQRFADVPPTYWAAPAIDGLAAAGLIQGVAPGLFDPGAPVTRAEFAALLAAVRGLPPGTPGPAFTDVSAGAWYAPAVEAVAGEGWMEGRGNGAFDPQGEITRAQAATALVASLGLGQVAADAASGPCGAGCAAVPPWARGSVAVAAGLGLLRGNAAGQVMADAPLTRAEAAEMLWRLRDLPASAVAAQAGAVAATIDASASATALAVDGPPATLRAAAHDASGFLLPCAYVWHVSGPAVLQAAGGTATVRATGPGPVRVDVSVAGEAAVSATVPLRALVAGRLEVSGVPPAGLHGATFGVTASARTASGAPDPAAAAEVVLRAARRGGPVVRTVAARAEGGAATLPFPSLGPGRYVLTIIWPGLPAVRLPYAALVRPEGQLVASSSAGSLRAGAVATVAASSSVPGTWPVLASASGLGLGPPPLAGDPPAPAVLSLRPEAAAVVGGGGPVAVAAARANAPGPATVRVFVPGGALRAASLRMNVRPAGALRPAGTAPARTTAGTAVTVEAAVTGGLQGVAVEPVDPAGHPLPAVAAAVSGGIARATLTPRQAGIWHLLWLAPGAVPADVGTLAVAPGPAVALVLDATPSSFVRPGQAVTVRAWLADAEGNPIPEPFRLRVLRGGSGAGTLTLARGRLGGPGRAGSFRAGAGTGQVVLSATSPDHPGLQPAHLVLTVEASAVAAVSGPGIWVTFPDWKAEGTAGVLAAARRDHATHIYLEVATSSDGFYGGRALDSLLPAAHAAGIAVLAWIYPALQNVPQDLAILRAVAAYRSPAGDRADGLALDIEDQLTPSRVARYARAAAALEGRGGLVVGITWAPQQMPSYPYRALAPYVSAFAPMDYWHTLQENYSYAQVYDWVRTSVQRIRQAAGRPTVPIDVIAETFDWFSPVTGRGLWSPSALELQAAIAAASDSGAAGISFYRPSTATPAEQAVMARLTAAGAA